MYLQKDAPKDERFSRAKNAEKLFSKQRHTVRSKYSNNNLYFGRSKLLSNVRLKEDCFKQLCRAVIFSGMLVGV